MATKIIDSLTIGTETGVLSVPYTTCSTAAAIAAKTVSVQNFSLEEGAQIVVKFTTTNTASNPTLKVGDTEAKSIKYRNSAISAGYLAANRIYTFVYDGTDWELIGDINIDNNTKNTAGATNTSSKIFLVGATAQTENPTTYSHDTAFVDANGKLNSASTTSTDAGTVVTTKDYVDNLIGANDAMVFKGTVEAGDTTAETGYTPAANTGDTYKVANIGYVNGQIYQAGDMFICIEDGTPAATSSNLSTIKSKWTVVQTNIHVIDTILDAPGSVPDARAVYEYAPSRTEFNGHKHTVSHTPAGTIANASVTPAGTVSSTFKGTQAGHSHTFTGEEQTVSTTTVAKGSNSTATVTAKGTNSGTKVTVSGTAANTLVTPKGTVSVSTSAPDSGVTATYTPAGSVSSSFSGTNFDHSHTWSDDISHDHSFTGKAGTATATYTPAGSVASHSHSVTPTPVTVLTGVKAGGTGDALTKVSGAIANRNLTISSSASSFVTSVTSNGTASVVQSIALGNTAPTFTGTEATITSSYTPTGSVGQTTLTAGGTTNTVSYTPAGSVTSTFTGTGRMINASFTGTAENHSHAVSASEAEAHTHTFTGTEVEHTHTFTGSASNVSVTFTPEGTISTVNLTPAGSVTSTFTGTAANHNHEFTGTAATLTTSVPTVLSVAAEEAIEE